MLISLTSNQIEATNIFGVNQIIESNTYKILINFSNITKVVITLAPTKIWCGN